MVEGFPKPVFTFGELIRWAKKQKASKYRRLYKAKRYISIAEVDKTPRFFCSRKRLRQQCRCSLLVETSDGKTLISPKPAEVTTWLEQTASIAVPPCPVQLLEGYGYDVGITGFCAVSVSSDTVRQDDKAEYVLYDEKTKQHLLQTPPSPPDPLEPRPWLSWSDLFIKERRDPSSPFDAVDEADEKNSVPASNAVLSNGDLPVYLQRFAESEKQRHSKRKTWIIRLLPLLNRIEPLEEGFSEIHFWTILTLMGIEENMRPS